MRKELDAALCKDFPLIFKDRHAPMDRTCMCWGFSCLDGWEPLIRCLCEALMWDSSTGKQRENPPIAMQVKEKFGTLRFYVGGAEDNQYDIIQFAENLSATICESCGSMVDVTQTQGWVKTRCETCHKKEGDDEDEF